MRKLTGKEMRICRINLGYTQGSLAREVGITSGMIGHIERGERLMSDEISRRVKQVFGLSDDEIEEIIAVHERLNKKKISAKTG